MSIFLLPLPEYITTILKSQKRVGKKQIEITKRRRRKKGRGEERACTRSYYTPGRGGFFSLEVRRMGELYPVLQGKKKNSEVDSAKRL